MKTGHIANLQNRTVNRKNRTVRYGFFSSKTCMKINILTRVATYNLLEGFLTRLITENIKTTNFDANCHKSGLETPPTRVF